jgi:purine-binding chemotaxis protein CheW
LTSTAPTLPDVREDAAARTLLYRVGRTVYGSDIADIREVVPYRRVTRLPGAPAHVQGLLNLRGTIVTVLDLGRRLDPTRDPVRSGSILIATVGSRLTGIAVDDVMDVRPVVADELTAAGATLDGAVIGLGHSAAQVVILIDIPTLVQHVLL